MEEKTDNGEETIPKSRQKKEAPKEKEEGRFRRMVENLGDGLTIMENRKVFYLNPRACDIFGYSWEELVKLSTLELAAPEEKERLQGIMKESWETGIPTRELEFWVAQKDGSRRCVHNRYSINHKNNEIIGRYVVSTDITERKKGEERLRKETEELRKENERLKAHDKVKNEFISVLAHDLGTPLVIMQGNIELMKTWAEDKLTEKLPKKMDLLLRNVKRLDKLRKDTLDLSRMDQGTMGIQKEPLLLKKIILEAVEDVGKMADDKKQMITTKLPDLDEVYCDKEKIRQVLDNYLSNAIQYTPQEGKIKVGGEIDENCVTVWVKDTGRGLLPEETKKVFWRFYRAGERVGDSTGLGLSIAKGIVEAHGGQVWCESEGKDKGSTFYFSIPIRKEENQKSAHNSEKKNKGTQNHEENRKSTPNPEGSRKSTHDSDKKNESTQNPKKSRKSTQDKENNVKQEFGSQGSPKAEKEETGTE